MTVDAVVTEEEEEVVVIDGEVADRDDDVVVVVVVGVTDNAEEDGMAVAREIVLAEVSVGGFTTTGVSKAEIEAVATLDKLGSFVEVAVMDELGMSGLDGIVEDGPLVFIIRCFSSCMMRAASSFFKKRPSTTSLNNRIHTTSSNTSNSMFVTRSMQIRGFLLCDVVFTFPLCSSLPS